MVRRRISNELKDTALSMSLQGLSDSRIREYTGISERSLKRLRHTYRATTGEGTRPGLASPGQARTVGPVETRFLRDCIERHPDAALVELQAQLRHEHHVEVSLDAVMRTLRKEGYTMKTITQSAVDLSKEKRNAYKAHISEHFRTDQLVFADESQFSRLTMKRPYVWAPQGKRARCREVFLGGKLYSVLPAISLDGILHAEVLGRAVTDDDFRLFVRALLQHMNKWPLPNSVLVVDDTPLHKVAGVHEMVEAHGARLVFLPTHSPDLNPVELVLSSVKARLRAHRDRAPQAGEDPGSAASSAPDAVIREAIGAVTRRDAVDWFEQSGYIVP